MERYKEIILFFLILFLSLNSQGQTALISSGSDAEGPGGSVSYSVGQLTYRTLTGYAGGLTQGVQQPYEITVATAIEDEMSVTLEYRVYPNPTAGRIILVIRPREGDDYSYRLYDMSGVLLHQSDVESDESEVSMESLRPDAYFLVVFRNNVEIRVFKVIKIQP